MKIEIIFEIKITEMHASCIMKFFFPQNMEYFTALRELWEKKKVDWIYDGINRIESLLRGGEWNETHLNSAKKESSV